MRELATSGAYGTEENTKAYVYIQIKMQNIYDAYLISKKQNL